MPRSVVRRNRMWGYLPRRTTFSLSPTSRAFTCEAGATSVTPQTISVVNDGTQGLGVVTAGSPSEAWLTVTVLGNADDGYTLVLTVDPTGLAEDTYAATCVISSSNAAQTRTLTADLVVTAATLPEAIIEPGHTSVDFRAIEGATGATPASDIVNFTNRGAGDFAGLQAVASAAYVSATFAGTALTVTPAGAGLAALPEGVALSTITVTDANATGSVQLSVLVNVGAGAPAQTFINVIPGSLSIAGTEGDGTTHAASALVQNGGAGTLTLPTLGTVSYGAGWSGGLSVAITGAAAPYTLTATATTGALAAGTYVATFSVSGGGAVNTVIVTTTFVVGSSAPTLYDPPRWNLPSYATFDTADNQVEGEPMVLPALGDFS